MQVAPSNLPCHLQSLMCFPASSRMPGIKGSPCMSFALALAMTVVEAWDHVECSCCVDAAFLLCV